MSRLRHVLLLPALALVATASGFAPLIAATPSVHAELQSPVLHEQIPPDPHEDIALAVALDGDLPAALDTKSGVVSAPDPRKPVAPGDSAYAQGERESATFSPDRNTKRPEVQGYDEPFTPSTAPFKRLEAFDAVDQTYQLYVRDKRLAQMPTNALPATDGSDEQFYADIVVDIAPGRRVRVPSVGPGARIVRARLGVGAQDFAFHILHDGADNWFAEALGPTGGAGANPIASLSQARARLVMELTIARRTFGGDFADASWTDLPSLPPVPDNVARSATDVQSAIGVSRKMRPREVVGRLVTYFRSFADSDDPPRGRADIYLDLALSKKGVCRHRAFAFLVTAESLGIPTRMIINEAHAWVEVHDGQMWRRIDLGGAGHMTNPASNAIPERALHQPPPDPFAWPQGSERGDDMINDARQRARMSGSSGGGQPGTGGTPQASPSASSAGGKGEAKGAASGSTSNNGPGQGQGQGGTDERPLSAVTVRVDDTDAHRGQPLRTSGDVRADNEPCPHVAVELYLRDVKTGKMLLLGSLATDDAGSYSGAIVVPGTTPLGDYVVDARTPGDAHCGPGASP
jgi:hypothetical protein